MAGDMNAPARPHREFMKVPSSQPTENREAFQQLGLIVLLYICAIAIIGPAGNFDMGDAFVYAHGVDTVLKTGQLSLGGSIATCYFHLLVGAATCSLFGATHQTLAYLSLVWGLAFIFIFWFLAREIGCSERLATLCTLLVLFNPMVLYLCFAFMTDVPFFTLTSLFALFCLKAIKRRSLMFLILATLCLDCSIAVRQIGIVNMLPGLCVLLAVRKSKRDLSIGVLASVVVPLVLLYGLMHMPKDHVTVMSSSIMTWHYAELFKLITHHPLMWVFKTMAILTEMACYAGLFCMPLLLSFVVRQYRVKSKIPTMCAVVAGLVMATGLSFWLFHRVLLMPFDGNMMIPPWLGPLWVIGGVLGYIPVWVRLLLTATGAFMGTALIVILCLSLSPNVCNLTLASLRRLTDGVSRPYRADSLIGWFIGLSVLVNIGFITFHLSVFDVDRYQLPLLPWLLLCLVLAARKLKVEPSLRLAAPLTVLLMIYSVASMEDHMHAQHARYKAIDQLITAGVKPAAIDGGLEYDAAMNFGLCDTVQPDDPTNFAASSRGTEVTRKLRQWPINGEDYIISMTPVPGYDIKSRVPFWSLVRLREREILVLSKASEIGSVQKKLP